MSKTKTVKWVVVEHTMMGRYVALRGLSFATQEDAQAHIVTKINERYRCRYHVESRTQKVKAEGYQMTCQCCGRAIFAETGTIAHHGYERPGDGWQTASCMGAKALPFEVSRNRLGDQIKALKDHLSVLVEDRSIVANESVPVLYVRTNHNAKPLVERGYGSRREYPTVSLEFTRVNFAEVLADNTGPRGSDKLWDGYDALRMEQEGFDGILAADLNRRDGAIKNVREHLKECQDRYDAWKQTHKRVGDNWVRV